MLLVVLVIVLHHGVLVVHHCLVVVSLAPWCTGGVLAYRERDAEICALPNPLPPPSLASQRYKARPRDLNLLDPATLNPKS